MYAFVGACGGSSAIFATVLLLSSNAIASPAIRRAVTVDPLDPWVSVDASGSPVATITPAVTTIDGVATTISAAPAILTATTTSQSDKKPSPTSGALPEATGGGSFQVCHNMDGDFSPFCKPDNGSSVYVGETYYVTWDTNFFTMKNATVQLLVNYVNDTGGGLQAFESSSTASNRGFISWTIDKAWLKGLSFNNVTLFLVPYDPDLNEPEGFQGPTVMVMNRPKDWYRQEPTKAPTGKEIYIGLPVIFGFIILCVGGGFVVNRKKRKIGLGNVMGRRKGYGIGKSSKQRLGLSKKGAGAIRLREQELTAGGQYRDLPAERDVRARNGAADADALGSLAATPTEERTN